MIRSFRDYSIKMLEEKGVLNPSGRTINKTIFAVRKAYNTIYKAVAYDIDGTITDPGTVQINLQIAKAIAFHLQIGVPVLLVTGRGRTTSKAAANQILELSGIDSRYATRLNCITHNGLIWLKTPVSNPDDVLGQEIKLCNSFTLLHTLREKIMGIGIVKNGQLEGLLEMSEEPSNDPNALRICIPDGSPYIERVLEIEKEIKKLTSAISSNGEEIFITLGKYGKIHSIDISNTNKVKAIESYCQKSGIRLDEILRIGDSGDENGNDFEFLNSSRAFSVGSTGKQHDKCFLVLDDKCEKKLEGAEATITLLSRIKILPPLTLIPNSDHDQLNALHQFEKNAITRTKREYELLFNQIKLRLDRLLMNDESWSDIQNYTRFDIFENNNGGVRLRDWEVTELKANHPLRRQFELDDKVFYDYENCRLKWALLTDDAVLLRGINYYWGLTHDTSGSGYLTKFINDSLSFIEQSIINIQSVLSEDVTFVKYKFILGIMDNIRNILLQILYGIYITDILSKNNFRNTKKFYNLSVLKHTNIHYNALLNSNYHWKKLLSDYISILKETQSQIALIRNQIVPFEMSYHKPLLRKWRECDDFIQNILAIEIGLHEFEGLILNNNSKVNQFYVIGLVNGGIELPAIAKCLSKIKNIRVVSGFLNLSLYSNQEKRKKILDDEIDLSEIISEETVENSLVLFDSKKSKAELIKGLTIIVDDNCTTGRTIQLARDMLVNIGAEVLGAIAVRYPASNRYKQMQFPNHGLPDPEILLSFIRGLVCPSPYTRLMKVNNQNENKYLDSTGIFDIARWQLERYLEKNK